MIDLRNNQEFTRLIEANAPYWAAESEVISSYWTSGIRSLQTDIKWIKHQLYKEYFDGIFSYTNLLNDVISQTIKPSQLDSIITYANVIKEEAEHFSLFLSLISEIRSDYSSLEAKDLREASDWPENQDLISLRKDHIRLSNKVGLRASKFTEGGYVALFREGKNIPIKSDIDIKISHTCGMILEDEFEHMILGIADLSLADFTELDWKLLTDFSVEQMKKRILMRNAQFSFPISDARLSMLLEGNAKPIDFDYHLASSLLNSKCL